jgi:alanyl-tRNA synthetase
MQSSEIRKRFLHFFEKRGHAIIPSASLVPENDPSVLFTTAGMQPLVPYLLGEAHPKGKRLVNVQKCVRTGDIEEIGDNTHLTFFEMLGNWSLGDYFKKEAIEWSFELLTSKEEGFGLDPKRLYVTVFEGDENAPKDEESYGIWKNIFEKHNILGERIYFLPAKSNWWSAGDNGPCGPDTEMFYDLTGALTDGLSKEEFLKADQEQKVVEIWNNVFMEYEKKEGKVIGKLKVSNVDTGSGLERMTTVLQGKKSVFDTDLFVPILSVIEQKSNHSDDKAKRIIADHIRAAVFMIADGVIPSNTDRGYILRRLIRRAVRYGDLIGLPQDSLKELSEVVKEQYVPIYSELATERLGEIIQAEEAKFRETLGEGLKYFSKGTDAFTLFTTYGFPFELTEELAKEKGQTVDRKEFEEKMKAHQNLSRSGAEQKFKGGLANQSEETVKLHTAHHLLLSALQEVLGKEVKQKGSNITEERLRIDFAFPRKLTEEEKQKVEDLVNVHIKADHTVVRREMAKIEAETIGAEMEFGAKYPDVVSIYFIEDKKGNAISKEFCGGPHVEQTGSLGAFRIQKEEAVSAGVRRIKATLS